MTYTFEKLQGLYAISHHMVCPEESDLIAEFRVIGCGYGAWISSSWRRDFVRGEVLLLIPMTLCDHHKLSYAPQRPWFHVRMENVWMVWSQDCSDNVLHDPAQLTALSVSNQFLGSPNSWTSPYFRGFCVLKKCQNFDKMDHPCFSQEHLDLLYFIMGTELR